MQIDKKPHRVSTSVTEAMFQKLEDGRIKYKREASDFARWVFELWCDREDVGGVHETTNGCARKCQEPKRED